MQNTDMEEDAAIRRDCYLGRINDRCNQDPHKENLVGLAIQSVAEIEQMVGFKYIPMSGRYVSQEERFVVLTVLPNTWLDLKFAFENELDALEASLSYIICPLERSAFRAAYSVARGLMARMYLQLGTNHNMVLPMDISRLPVDLFLGRFQDVQMAAKYQVSWTDRLVN